VSSKTGVGMVRSSVAMLAATRVITGIRHTLPNMSAMSMDYANNPTATLPLRTPRSGNLAPRTAPHTTRMIRVRATLPRMTTPTWLPHRAILDTVAVRTVTVLPMVTAHLLTVLRTVLPVLHTVLPVLRTVPPVLRTVMARSTSLLTVLPTDMATLVPMS
jgi:hypothetical protein